MGRARDRCCGEASPCRRTRRRSVAHKGVQFDRLGRPFVSMTRRLATISFLACCGLEILLTNHILRFNSFGNQTLLCLHAYCSNSYGYMRFRDLSMIVLRVSIRFGSIYLVALRLLSLHPLGGYMLGEKNVWMFVFTVPTPLCSCKGPQWPATS